MVEVKRGRDLSIAEAARVSGLTPSAIRYYERNGVTPAPPRTSGRRCYAPEAIRVLRLVRRLREAGLRLRDIRRWTDAVSSGGSSAGLRALAECESERLRDEENAIKERRRILDSMLGCLCVRIEECAAITKGL